MVPKNFIIRCPKCRWAKMTTGLKDDLKDLHEIVSSCLTCHKGRKFQCPQCGDKAMMKRVRGNS